MYERRNGQWVNAGQLDQLLQFRMSKSEKEKVEDAASRCGVTVSGWVRSVLVAAADARIEADKQPGLMDTFRAEL